MKKFSKTWGIARLIGSAIAGVVAGLVIVAVAAWLFGLWVW